MAGARLLFRLEDDGRQRHFAAELHCHSTGASLGGVASCAICIGEDMECGGKVRWVSPGPLSQRETSFDVRQESQQGFVVHHGTGTHVACQGDDRTKEIWARHASCVKQLHEDTRRNGSVPSCRRSESFCSTGSNGSGHKGSLRYGVGEMRETTSPVSL